MSWTPPPVETDPDAVTSRLLAELRDRIDGYETHEGDPLTILAEELGRETAVLGQTVVAALESAIAGIGQTVFGLPAITATPASMLVRLEVVADGVLPPGFTVTGVTAAGEEIAFRVADERPVTTGNVDLVMTAVVPGAAANTIPPGPLTVVTATAVVATATALADEFPQTGTDAETRPEYLTRLTSYLSTLRPGGVRADDLALLARSVPGVHRVLGLDLYDPAAPGVASERTATVVPVDAAGLPVSEAVADQVAATLEAARELNFIVHVGQPTYTSVEVEFEAVAVEGGDVDAIEAAVVAAVEGFLSPARWGAPAGDPRGWAEATVIRYLDLARVAGSVEGVAYLSSLTIDGAAADKILTGVAAMPAAINDALDPSVVAGTVTMDDTGV